jgi:hypothetical protein
MQLAWFLEFCSIWFTAKVGDCSLVFFGADINECTEKTRCQCPECQCKNTWGSYDCQCSSGLLYIHEHDICISESYVPFNSSRVLLLCEDFTQVYL